MKLHLSAKEPDTRVAAVAAKTNWKNHLDSLYAEIIIFRRNSFFLRRPDPVTQTPYMFLCEMMFVLM